MRLPRASFLPLFCFLAALVCHASVTPEQMEAYRLLKEFERVKGALRTHFETPSLCANNASFFQPSEKHGCDFKDYCEFFQKNATSGVLYQNDAGEKIPNFYLEGLSGMLRDCYNRKRNDYQQFATQKTNNTQSNSISAFAAANQKFLEKIKQDGDEAVFLDFEIAHSAWIQKAMSENKPDPLMELMMEPSSSVEEKRKTIKTYLETLEKMSGKKFKNESTRELFVDTYLSVFQDPVDNKAAKTFPEWQFTYEDPFLNPELFYDSKAAGGGDKLEKNKQLYQKQSARADAIFQNVKKTLIEVLKKKGASNEMIQNMVHRIETVQLVIPPMDAHYRTDGNYDDCQHGPNAFYNPSAHSFILCPQTLESPEYSLKQIIAHELGHAIDPCQMSNTLISSVAPNSESLPGITQTHPGQNFWMRWDYNVGVSGEVPRGDKVEAKSCSEDQNPFLSVINCLYSEDSIHARRTNEQDLAKSLKQEIENELKSGMTEENNPGLAEMMTVQKLLPDLIAQKGGCAELAPAGEKTSQIQEAFSDWVSAEVIGYDLNHATPGKRKTLAFESLAFFPATTCYEVESDVRNQVNTFLLEKGCQAELDALNFVQGVLKKAKDLVADEHPPDYMRVNRVLLAQPEIQTALGCPDSNGVKHCE